MVVELDKQPVPPESSLYNSNVTSKEVLDSLFTITQKFACVDDTGTLLKHLVHELRILFNALAVSIYLPSNRSGNLILFSNSGERPNAGRITGDEHSIINQCRHSQDTVFLNGLSGDTDSALTQYYQSVAIPLNINSEFLGVLALDFEEDRYDIHYKIELIEQTTHLAAMAIGNARLIHQSSAELDRNKAITRLNKIVRNELSLWNILDEACKTAIAHSCASRACIVQLVPHITEEMAWWVESPRSGAFERKVAKFDAKYTSALNWCIGNRESVLLEPNHQHKSETRREFELRQSADAGCISLIPLLQKQACWGVQIVRSDCAADDFDPATAMMFEVIAGQAAVAIHRHILLNQIQYQSCHDIVTRLPNRRRFLAELNAMVTDLPTTAMVGILCCGLDGFKAIHDSQGHVTGDTLLRMVGERFSQHIRDGDLLARLSDDEFGLLINDIDAASDAMAVANRLSESLNQDFIIDGHAYRLSASFGVTLYPSDADDPSMLLKNADVAMHQAKNHGLNHLQRYSQQLSDSYNRDIEIEIALSHALVRDQFEVYYQPKVRACDGVVSGVEALIRWNHPQHGIIMPSDFIPIAEKTRLIAGIGDWVLEQACQQTAVWHAMGHEIHVAVNVSSQQFQMDSFVDKVSAALNQNNLHPGYLELEVTESIVMKNMDRVISKLQELKSIGVEVSVDDFGTGYSSLRYLQDLPLDTLKIDRAFVTQLDFCESNKSLVNTIVLMAKSFGLTTVAEGVETREQLQKVVDLGCEYIQGYYYSRPIPAADVPGQIEQIEQMRLAQAWPLAVGH